VTTETPKPDWWIEVEGRLAKITAADLPPAPWVLKRTEPGRAMAVLGGPFITVLDNEIFLGRLKEDVSEGPNGVRGAVVMGDLRALKNALKERGDYDREPA
jgi:hypothetical protein